MVPAAKVKGGKVYAFCTKVPCRPLQGLQGGKCNFRLAKNAFFFFFHLARPSCPPVRTF